MLRLKPPDTVPQNFVDADTLVRESPPADATNATTVLATVFFGVEPATLTISELARVRFTHFMFTRSAQPCFCSSER